MEDKTVLEKWGISASVLWVLVILFFTMDHFGAGFLEPGVLGAFTEEGMDIYSKYMGPDLLLRVFGAIGFPILAFLFVDGFRRAENVKEYAMKLLAVAVVAEIPFDLAFYQAPIYLWHQNVFFTLLSALVMLEALKRYGSNMVKKTLILIGGCALSVVVSGDHGIEGIVIISAMYLLWDRPVFQTIFCSLILIQNPISPLGVLAFIPIRLYDGTNYEKLQNAFYVFYPAHILLIYLARIAIFKA